MPNSRSKQTYVKDFYCKYISFKKSANLFEQIEIDEYIYENVVEPSYKNLPGNMKTML